MSLMESLKKGAMAALEDFLTPEEFKKGEAFEDYVRDTLFPANEYHLVERTHNYAQNGKDYVEQSLNPDFHFRHIKSKKEFYVEAKYRSQMGKDDKVQWCKASQLKRYPEINKKLPVFVALGLGGEPESPRTVSVFPVKKTKYTSLFKSVVTKYEVPLKITIKQSTLWALLK